MPVVVLGSNVKRELFGDRNPLGQVVRIGGYPFRVVGVMESQGQVLDFDLNDSVYIAVANGMQMDNFDEVVETDVAYDSAQWWTGWSARSGRSSLPGIGKGRFYRHQSTQQY